MAIDPLKTYQQCRRCMGTGIASEIHGGEPENPCTQCGGDGFVDTGYVGGAEELDWIKKKIKKILDKLEIPE